MVGSKTTSFHLSTKESSFLFQREGQPLQTSGYAPHLGDSLATTKPSRSKAPRETNASHNDEQAPQVLKGGIALLSDELALAMPSNMIALTEFDGNTRNTRIYTSSGRGARKTLVQWCCCSSFIRMLDYRGYCS